MKNPYIIISAAVFAFTAAPGWALDGKKSNEASGLAKIIVFAEPCGYALDDAALEAYYVKAGLSTPEGLSFITSMGALYGDEPPTKANCTLAKSTARSIGILAD